jgi:hypothetical protein
MQFRHLATATLAVGLTGLGSAVPATAAGSPLVAVADESTAIRYLSGGIGLEDRQRLEETAGDFDLKLVFAEPHGEYLADVPVVIEDTHGNAVLRATSQGPWFYAELPPGRYTVAIPQAGAQYTRSVEVPRHGQKEVLIHQQEVFVERPLVSKETPVETPTMTREIVVEKPIGMLRSCPYSSTAYSDGSISCQNGYQYRCDDGTWDSRGRPC